VLSAIERAQYQEFFEIARARKAQTGVDWTVDHDVPLSRGGLDHPSNLMLLPRDVNSAKGGRYGSTLAFLLS
jgi:5-methylcytosine-specific restriction endonuclease McrA